MGIQDENIPDVLFDEGKQEEALLEGQNEELTA